MLLPAGFFSCLYDLARDYRAIGFRNFELFHFARDDLLYLVLQAECHFRNLGRSNGGFDQIVAVGGEN